MADISPDNGGVFFYPGTHLEPVLPTRQLSGGPGPNQDPNAANEECIVPDKYQPVDVMLPAGSSAVFHGHLVHGSHRNRSSGFRNVLLTTYIRKGENFRAGFTAKRTEVPLKIAS
jgi:phytanoyl-CoA hydroxylase